MRPAKLAAWRALRDLAVTRIPQCTKVMNLCRLITILGYAPFGRRATTGLSATRSNRATARLPTLGALTSGESLRFATLQWWRESRERRSTHRTVQGHVSAGEDRCGGEAGHSLRNRVRRVRILLGAPFESDR